MNRENVTRLRLYPKELAPHPPEAVGVDEQQLSTLQQRAMRAAEAYGCHAGIEVADSIASASDPAGSLRMKIVVARLSRQGELLSHESNVVLMTNERAASVERIVRDAAAKLAAR